MWCWTMLTEHRVTRIEFHDPVSLLHARHGSTTHTFCHSCSTLCPATCSGVCLAGTPAAGASHPTRHMSSRLMAFPCSCRILVQTFILISCLLLLDVTVCSKLALTVVSDCLMCFNSSANLSKKKSTLFANVALRKKCGQAKWLFSCYGQ